MSFGEMFGGGRRYPPDLFRLAGWIRQLIHDYDADKQDMLGLVEIIVNNTSPREAMEIAKLFDELKITPPNWRDIFKAVLMRKYRPHEMSKVH